MLSAAFEHSSTVLKEGASVLAGCGKNGALILEYWDFSFRLFTLRAPQLLDLHPNIWEPGLLSMQDNAPMYTARAVRQWLEDIGIDLREWPPYSPD